MTKSFKETLEALVTERVAAGEDPVDLFEELAREANLVFGHYNLEYDLGWMLEGQGLSTFSRAPMNTDRLAA